MISRYIYGLVDNTGFGHSVHAIRHEWYTADPIVYISEHFEKNPDVRAVIFFRACREDMAGFGFLFYENQNGVPVQMEEKPFHKKYPEFK